MAAEGYDFVEDCTRDGRKIRMLNVVEPSGSPEVDESTRECLCIRVGRKLGSADVIDVLADLFMARGMPGFIRSNNGAEFVATAVKGWISGVGSKTAFIEPNSLWENGYVKNFNGKLRDELLNMEVFNTLKAAQILIAHWRTHYNTVRPHSSLGYQPPAPEVVVAGVPIMPRGRPGPTGPHQSSATMLLSGCETSFAASAIRRALVVSQGPARPRGSGLVSSGLALRCSAVT